MKKILTTILCASAMSCFAQFDFGGGGQGGLNGYTTKTNVDYVGDNKVYHKMDIYYPKEQKDKYPVIIHIYGSAWQNNDGKGSADVSTVGQGAVDAGYIFVTPNHRAINDGQWPAQINDIKAVIRYLRGNADDLKIDTSFIGISGFSSGGHLASVAGTTSNVHGNYTVGTATMNIEGTLGKFTSYSSSVDAVCDWSGPVILQKMKCGNAMPMNPLPEDQLMGGCSYTTCPDKFALLSANTYIDPEDPPIMIVHGSSDNVVPQCQGTLFYEDLLANGYPNGEKEGYYEYIQTTGGHSVDGTKVPDMIRFFNGARKRKEESQVVAGAPVVTITAPKTGDQFETSDNIEITATATDEDGSVQLVEFFNGSTKLGEAKSAPYKFVWKNVPAGTFTIKVVATDNEKKTATKSINIVVKAPEINGEIIVRAKGIDGGEGIQLEVDGKVIEKWTLTKDYKDYKTTANVNGKIVINYPNDNGDAQIDYIEVAGVKYEAEDQQVNTAYYANGQCGGGCCSEMMHCNGYIEFATEPVMPEIVDNCPDDPDKTEPGECGCGVPEGTCDDEMTIELEAGWNWIGCPIAGGISVEKALKDIMDKVIVIKSKDGYYMPSGDSKFNSLKELEWGRGYLLKVSSDCTLDWKY